MDPVSAISNAVGQLANAATYIGIGKRQKRERWGEVFRPGDYEYENNTSTILIGLGALVLVIIIVAIARKK